MSLAGLPLQRDFYARDTVTVSRALLGQRLVRLLDGKRLSGRITETEAYLGPSDPASHAYRYTPRSAIMYGPPGFAYVYFIYGAHFCMNAVTEPDGLAGAVLIRGMLPEEGLEEMAARRGANLARVAPRSYLGLTDGPGKLCQALGITRDQNGVDLTLAGVLFIEPGAPVPNTEVSTTVRIGIRGDEVTQRRPWRFLWHPQGQDKATG